MFKHAMCYRHEADWSVAVEELEAALARTPFHPCGATQTLSVGWVPPRGQEHGPLVELVGGQRILRLVIETKSVPASVLNRHLDERLARIEAQEGRSPGRRERKDLREEIERELLPMAFAKTVSINVWHDPVKHRVVLDCSSQARADQVLTALVEACPSWRMWALDTQVTPQAAMTQWITGTAEEWPEHFAPGREIELKSADELKSVVRFSRHPLDTEDMRHHVSQGKWPTQLALDWDGRVAFVLTEPGYLKKIAFLDGVFEDNGRSEDEGGFDADAAILTGELSALLDDLIEALGGETP